MDSVRCHCFGCKIISIVSPARLCFRFQPLTYYVYASRLERQLALPCICSSSSPALDHVGDARRDVGPCTALWTWSMGACGKGASRHSFHVISVSGVDELWDLVSGRVENTLMAAGSIEGVDTALRSVNGRSECDWNLWTRAGCRLERESSSSSAPIIIIISRARPLD